MGPVPGRYRYSIFYGLAGWRPDTAKRRNEVNQRKIQTRHFRENTLWRTVSWMVLTSVDRTRTLVPLPLYQTSAGLCYTNSTTINMERPAGPSRLRAWKLICNAAQFTLSEKARWFQVCRILREMAVGRGLKVASTCSCSRKQDCGSSHHPTVSGACCDGASCAESALVIVGTGLKVPLDLSHWQLSPCKTQTYFHVKDCIFERKIEGFLDDICHVLGFLYPDVFLVQCEYDYMTWSDRLKITNRLSDCQGEKLESTRYEDHLRSLQNQIPTLTDLCQASVLANREFNGKHEVAVALKAFHLY